MPKVNWDDISQQMLGAAARNFKRYWTVAAPYAAAEFASFTADMAAIETLVTTNQISPEDAADMVAIQKDSMAAVFLTIEGISLLTIEQAVNAALQIALTALSSSIGIALI